MNNNGIQPKRGFLLYQPSSHPCPTDLTVLCAPSPVPMAFWSCCMKHTHSCEGTSKSSWKIGIMKKLHTGFKTCLHLTSSSQFFYNIIEVLTGLLIRLSMPNVFKVLYVLFLFLFSVSVGKIGCVFVLFILR